ncbi:MAG: hypothetical protein ACFB2Z_02165 [Maricaulaceae bacterium]
MTQTSSSDPLGAAEQRLDAALTRLEHALHGLVDRIALPNGDAALLQELENSRAREAELADAAKAASQELGDAIADMRAAIEETPEWRR